MTQADLTHASREPADPAAPRTGLGQLMRGLSQRQDLVLVGLLVMTMAMMVLPMPTIFADVLIAVNIAISTLLMLTAIHIRRPIELFTLPTVVLITTAFRLSLSITTSRMVLVQGDAGEIIRAFGDFVIAGNVVVGLVVYLIITIVQFVVITKGSERVAEVAARFTLDALPGKQISIDTDLKNGDINQAEARRRRRLLEKESQFYGAMDGAMKFVKGDAIASLVIIVVNLIGGLTIGCLQRGLPFGDAVRTYALLAVGDGLIAQIPALLISLTSGIIVTRITSDDDGGNLGQDIVGQLLGDPRTLQITAVVLGGLAVVPGFPPAVFVALAAVFGAGGWVLARRRRETARQFQAAQANLKAAPEAGLLEVRAGATLAAFPGLAAALERQRAAIAMRLGIPIPSLRLSVPSLRISVTDLAPEAWRLDLDGVPVAAGQGDADAEVAVRQVGEAALRQAGQFVGIQETQALLNVMEAGYADLVREATKSAPLPRLAEVLRRLVQEEVSVANLRAVLEAVAEWAPREANTAVLAEHVRLRLSRQICHALAGTGGDGSQELCIVLVESGLDAALRGAVHATPNGTSLDLDDSTAARLIAALRPLLAPDGVARAVVVSADVRRHLRVLLLRHNLRAAVLGHAELAGGIAVRVVATLQRADVLTGPSLRPVAARSAAAQGQVQGQAA